MIRRRPTPHPAFALALGGLIALLTACGQQSDSDPAPGETAALAAGLREREAPLVTTTRLAARRMDRVLETTTVVESRSRVDVVPRVSEVVVEILAEEGDVVEVGTVLARLDRTELELAVRDAQVAESEARSAHGLAQLTVTENEKRLEQLLLSAEKAERDYQRDQQLAADPSKQFISAKERDATKLARDQAVHDHQQGALAVKRATMEVERAAIAVSRAKLGLERARVDLANADVRAPFAGVVARRNVRVGSTASTATAAFVLTDAEDLRAVIHRPQRELQLFTGGGALEITARAEALPGWIFEGRILRTSPTIDAESGSFRVTAALGGELSARRSGEATSAHAQAGDLDGSLDGNGAVDGPGDAAVVAPCLLPGMLVRLAIVTDRHDDAITVRKKALRHDGGDTFLFVIDGGRARRVRVLEGLEDDDVVEVRAADGSALSAGTEVVLVGHRDLEDDSPVRIKADPLGRAEQPESPAPAPAEADADPAAAPDASEGNE